MSLRPYEAPSMEPTPISPSVGGPGGTVATSSQFPHAAAAGDPAVYTEPSEDQVRPSCLAPYAEDQAAQYGAQLFGKAPTKVRQQQGQEPAVIRASALNAGGWAKQLETGIAAERLTRAGQVNYNAQGECSTKSAHTESQPPSQPPSPTEGKAGIACPYTAAETFISSRGCVNYSVTGTSGPLVVTFHGLNGTRLTFQDLCEVLKRFTFRVLSFDLYGHGLSACPPYGVCSSNYGVEFFVDQTDELLEHLGYQDERIALCGFSMGCIIAAGWAQRHPDRAAKLIMISPAGLIEAKPPAVKFLRRCRCYIPCVPFCLCKCCFRETKFIKSFSPEEQENGTARILWERLMWQLFVKKGVVPAFLGIVTRLPMWSAEDIFLEVGQTNIPTLVLWGTLDTVVPVTVAPRVLSCFKNSHLTTFPRSTHLVLTDAAQGSISCAVTFLMFPDNAELAEFQFLLPFSPTGTYRRRSYRHPPEISMAEYLDLLDYRPTHWIKIPGNSATERGIRSAGEEAAGEANVPHSEGQSSTGRASTAEQVYRSGGANAAREMHFR